MTENETYFIELLASYLKQEAPPVYTHADWKALFDLAQKHDVSAVLAHQIKALPQSARPPKRLASAFNQTLGYALIRFEEREQSLSVLTACLNRAKLPHLIVKGAVTRHLYPNPELRTSGDTDVVVSPKDYERSITLLQQAGFQLKNKKPFVAVLYYKRDVFELHNRLENLNEQSQKLLNNVFSPELSAPVSGYTYHLNADYALFYTALHLLYHIKKSGAGVRMLMDLDVLIRRHPNSLVSFLTLAQKCGLQKSCTVLLHLVHKWFDTPLSAVPENCSADLEEKLAGIIISGGIFGLDNGDTGAVFLSSQTKSGRITKRTRIRAFLRYLFPSSTYMYAQFPYAGKHHVLLPAAYIHRFFLGVFKNRMHTRRALDAITGKNKGAQTLAEILHELNI